MCAVIVYDNYTPVRTLFKFIIHFIIIEFFESKHKDIYYFCFISLVMFFISGTLVPVLYNLKVFDSIGDDVLWPCMRVFRFYMVFFVEVSIVWLAFCYMIGKKFNLNVSSYISLLLLCLSVLGGEILNTDYRNISKFISMGVSAVAITFFFLRKKHFIVIRYELLLLLLAMMASSSIFSTLTSFFKTTSKLLYTVPFFSIMILLILTLSDKNLEKVFYNIKYVVSFLVICSLFFLYDGFERPETILTSMSFITYFMFHARTIIKQKTGIYNI